MPCGSDQAYLPELVVRHRRVLHREHLRHAVVELGPGATGLFRALRLVVEDAVHHEAADQQVAAGRGGGIDGVAGLLVRQLVGVVPVVLRRRGARLLASFASVTVADTTDDVPPAGDPASGSSEASVWNSVDITLGNGRRLTVDVRVDEVALRRLLTVLEPPA